MSDHFYDDFNTEETKDINQPETQETAAPEVSTQESSYEWNSNGSNYRNGEYRYSYINGANSNASHNPNNYESAYSSPSSADTDPYKTETGYSSQSQYTNPYSSNYSAQHSYQNSYSYSQPSYTAPAEKKKKAEKKPKSASRGFVAAALAIAVLGSTALGFGGGYLLNQSQNNSGGSGSLTIKQVADSNGSGSEDSTGNASSEKTTAVSTSDIVKKTANSVVEIATEGTATGTFSRQYVTQGAGSGVIISEDGYIVTNHHVIEDTNKLTVTLRDGTEYEAKLIGSDEDNDIALLKIDATGLSAATFGNSSNLVVGDYVVAIGNPLGTLGGTVTDGIISALAREVTIEDKNLTLLQTNAQISPGNSGGGLFNANGELVGIVNAKDSATEVEGIAFAIPINNVVDIIKDLKDYGYVTGKIDTGMEFVDINSYDTAFYYNVSQLGVYVLSVSEDSKAMEAGFKSGDLITAVGGKDVSSSADIEKALEGKKVGDKVTFTVSRGGKTTDIELELSEYTPSVKPNSQDSESFKNYQSNDNLWDELFNW